jgi:hypothetical protein
MKHELNTPDTPRTGTTMDPARPVLRAAGSVGYLEASPEEGMSGGAVVDMQCGLWGITEAKSEFGVGGAFVLLSQTVVAMVLDAAAKL